MKWTRIFAWALVCALISVPSLAGAADNADGYIVRTEADVALPTEGAERLAEGVYLVRTRGLAERLAGETGSVEPNGSIELPDEPFEVFAETSAGQSETAELQALSAVYTVNAKTIELTGAKRLHALGLRGDGIRVAVIDSGFNRNCEIYYPPEYTGEERLALDKSGIEAGYDYVNGGDCLTDPKNHGTVVAACVLAVAPEAVIVPLRCFDAGGKSSTADLITAIDEAVNRYHCNVIHMSWGMTGNSPALCEEIGRAWDAGCVLVASSGNKAKSATEKTLYYPAAYEAVIGVGSVGSTCSVSGTSVQSAAVSLCALGEDTLYGYSGTSFAAPLVSGAAALLWGARPWLGNAEVKSELLFACDDLGDEGYDEAYGYGILNPETLFSVNAKAENNGLTVSGILRENELLAAYTAEGQLCGLYIGGEHACPGEAHYCARAFRRAAQARVYRLDGGFRILSEAESVRLLP